MHTNEHIVYWGDYSLPTMKLSPKAKTLCKRLGRMILTFVTRLGLTIWDATLLGSFCTILWVLTVISGSYLLDTSLFDLRILWNATVLVVPIYIWLTRWKQWQSTGVRVIACPLVIFLIYSFFIILN